MGHGPEIRSGRGCDECSTQGENGGHWGLAHGRDCEPVETGRSEESRAPRCTTGTHRGRKDIRIGERVRGDDSRGE